MILQGATYFTLDIDICFRREPDNISRLCRALAPYSSLLRSASLDVQNALLSQDMSIDTDLGRVDMLGVLDGIGDYESVAAFAEPIAIDDASILVLSLDGLIRTKESINRQKDQLHLAELRALKALADSKKGDDQQ